MSNSLKKIHKQTQLRIHGICFWPIHNEKIVNQNLNQFIKKKKIEKMLMRLTGSRINSNFFFHAIDDYKILCQLLDILFVLYVRLNQYINRMYQTQ